MKLVRFGKLGKEKTGVWINDNNGSKIIDVSSFGEDYDENFFARDGISRLRKWLEEKKISSHSIFEGIAGFNEIRLGSPLKRPSKIVCVGLNYAKHAEEAKMDIPKEPVLFFKSTTAIIGANDDVIIPQRGIKTDWEVELGVVIEKKASYVSKEEAMEYVAGYVLHNDISERHFQLERSGQWVKGKSCDTFAPLGPWLATKDEIPNPHKLNLWLKVNEEILQNGNTEDFIFDIPTVVSYISQFMTLLPGDVISTGTPFGVGLGLNPPRYLKEGDVMELGIDGLGVGKQRVKSYVKNV